MRNSVYFFCATYLHSLGLKTLNSSRLPYVLRVERMLGHPTPKQGSARMLVLITGPFSRMGQAVLGSST